MNKISKARKWLAVGSVTLVALLGVSGCSSETKMWTTDDIAEGAEVEGEVFVVNRSDGYSMECVFLGIGSYAGGPDCYWERAWKTR